jgi:hypothetical protein
VYLSVLSVRVVLRNRSLSDGAVTDEATALVGEELEVTVDDNFRAALQEFVFEQAGEPSAYSVTFTERHVEAGASSVVGEVLIELIAGATLAAWAVLAEVVAGWIRDQRTHED